MSTGIPETPVDIQAFCAVSMRYFVFCLILRWPPSETIAATVLARDLCHPAASQTAPDLTALYFVPRRLQATGNSLSLTSSRIPTDRSCPRTSASCDYGARWQTRTHGR